MRCLDCLAAPRICGGNRDYPRGLHIAWPDCHRRLAHSPHRLGLARGLIPLESQQSAVDCSDRRSRPDCLPIAAARVGDGEIALFEEMAHGRTDPAHLNTAAFYASTELLHRARYRRVRRNYLLFLLGSAACSLFTLTRRP